MRTKDIELTYTRNNKAYTKFTLAVNRSFKDEKGSQQADFIRVVAWGKQAENTAKFVKKGALIGVTGRIETGSYDDNGTTRYTTDVVANSITFLESKKSQHQEAGFNESVPSSHQAMSNGTPYAPDLRYTTDVVANSITFLESKKSQHQEAGFNESVPSSHQAMSNGTPYAPDFDSPHFNPFDPNFSNPNYVANYNSPFATATTMAGKIQNEPLININDDDLPY